jgi:CBS domain-containing protein
MTTTTTTIRAQDVMSKEPVCIELGTSLRDVARAFDQNQISGAPVIDGGGRLVGVVSRTDLVHRFLDDSLAHDPRTLADFFSGGIDDDEAPMESEPVVNVEEFMTDSPVTAPPTATLRELAKLMGDAHVHRVIIVDPSRIPIGIVTSLDLVRALAAE